MLVLLMKLSTLSSHLWRDCDPITTKMTNGRNGLGAYLHFDHELHAHAPRTLAISAQCSTGLIAAHEDSSAWLWDILRVKTLSCLTHDQDTMSPDCDESRMQQGLPLR